MPNFDDLIDFSSPVQDMELDIPVQEEGDDYVSDENQNLSDDDIFNDSEPNHDEP